MNLQHFLLLDTNQQALAYRNLASNDKTNLLLQLSLEIRQAVI